MDQQAAKTAKQMVVFVTRRDKWKARAAWNLNRIKVNDHGRADIHSEEGLEVLRCHHALALPTRSVGNVMNGVKRIISFFVGLARPFFPQWGKRTTAHHGA
jgi:hypothetical protein